MRTGQTLPSPLRPLLRRTAQRTQEGPLALLRIRPSPGQAWVSALPAVYTTARLRECVRVWGKRRPQRPGWGVESRRATPGLQALRPRADAGRRPRFRAGRGGPGKGDAGAAAAGRGSPPRTPGPAHLEVIAAEVHAAHERQHPGGLHGCAAAAVARPGEARAPGRAGPAPAPPPAPAPARPARAGHPDLCGSREGAAAGQGASGPH